MSLKYLIQTKKLEFSFNEIRQLLQLSEGYTRQLVAKMVKEKVLNQTKPKKDKRFIVYSLEWSLVRNYLLTGPSDFDEIILSIVEKKHHGYYVAIDDFHVKAVAETLMELTQTIGVLKADSTVLVTNAGTPKHQLTLGLS
ncbi:MAG: hypothetical protein HeimC3_32540 [Candidatus Heimdallarchaeota archaeon LC_3]|nr:MAG: hypothetical protein HeimC3_32540 [Candidatus Heimdallarchaeota archaeon LC_3]